MNEKKIQKSVIHPTTSSQIDSQNGIDSHPSLPNTFS